MLLSSRASLPSLHRVRSRSVCAQDAPELLFASASPVVKSVLSPRSPIERKKFPHPSRRVVKSHHDIESITPYYPPAHQDKPPCWDLKRIWEWYQDLPWLAGMNYLPRTAVNFVEMWDESSFDIEIIEEELKWASTKLGYNTLRTNVPMVLYEHDCRGLTKRINLFLDVAKTHGFSVILCPLDDCEFSGNPPKAGPQPPPIENLHNSQAIGSPGRRIVSNPSQWFRVKQYVQYFVRTWGRDERLLLLDLYNEPGNPWIFTTEGTKLVDNVDHFEECAFQLMQKVFQWAREENPTLPLTVSAWHMPDPFFRNTDVTPLAHRIDRKAMELSDVVSIHAYCDHNCLQATLSEVTGFGKPILLTEWMARQVQSTYDSTLPTLKELKVGAYQWGLVKGKTQTHLPWPHVAHQYQGDPMWWHDVLDEAGNFHNENEADLIRRVTLSHSLAKAVTVSSNDLHQGSKVEISVDVTNEGTDDEQQKMVNLAFPLNGTLTSETLLSEHTSQPNDISGSNLFDRARPPLSMHSLHMMQPETWIPSESETVHLPEGGSAVIPSVCSISMAAINAMAALSASEQLEKNESFLADNNLVHNTQSMPTFGAHMASYTIEGLDLELQGGIEF